MQKRFPSMRQILIGLGFITFLAVQVSMAGTGYRTDFDFPGRGDDWYGRALPDTRRDFPSNPVDEASDGDDFGRGYELLAASPGFGPPLASTQSPNHEYRFRFGDRYTDWQECYVDANCLDGLFCNGVESCSIGGTCSSGAPPSCDDADPCTADSCSNGLSSCVYDPMPDPGEVTSLTLSKLPLDTVATLTWTDQIAAEYFDIYRGERPDMSDMACYQTGIAATSFDDDGTIGADGLYEYLVNSIGCGGASSLGTDSTGGERTPAEWCP